MEDPRHPDINRLLRWGLFLQSAPTHRPLRNAVVAGLSARRIDALRPEAAAACSDLLHSLPTQPSPDLVSHFARPLAARMFCALCDLPPACADALPEDMDVINTALNDAPDAARSMRANAAAARLLALLQAHQSNAGSAMLIDMAARLVPDTPARASDLVAAFAIDAVETTASALACALDVLLRQPSLPASIHEGRWSLEAVVQEALRLTSPTMLSVRMAREPIAFDGTHIAAGTTLLMWWASANLDARVYPRPGSFDPERGARGHLAFGGGAHACLGRRLATLVTEEALRALRLGSGPRVERSGPTAYLPRLARAPATAPLRFADG
ncbi:cytochrome P450 [Luteimonas aestuarii]|uniref:Cytochrome P450 n=1 Tax=Luteimonas aestuarii TaxID=453837 RepID=A0A4R5TIR1_9GAMM|nr:cytochrome P450 [Luteimonas aestuarii]